MFKRVFLTFAMTVGLAVYVSAQGIVPVEDEYVNKTHNMVLKPYAFSIGPKVGANYSLASNPEGMNLNMSGNIGFSGGVAFNLRFGRPAGRPFGTERFGVQIEGLYSMRSLKTNVENIKLNCFEIPLLLQWYVIPTFAIEVGPTFTGAISTSPEHFNYNNTVYDISKIKAYDVMLSAGVNCKLKNGFTADIRYNMGNSNLAGNFKTKVSTVSIGIGWLFNVIK